MEIYGVYIHIGFFVLSVVLGIIAGVLLFWFQRVRIYTPSRRLTIPKLVFCVVGIAVAIYYILNVVFGQGRTGWP